MNENEMMNENDVEVLDTETTDVSEVSSSGNTIIYGVAAAGAAVLGGLVTAGIIIRNKIKAKKEAAAEADKSGKKEKPKKEHKGLKVGKGKYLKVVEDDQRTPQVEESKTEQ